MHDETALPKEEECRRRLDALGPYLAFACLLASMCGFMMLIHFAGHLFSLPLVKPSLLLSLPPALWFTYRAAFKAGRRHAAVAGFLGASLLLLGEASRTLWDFTADGMGYQQPAVQAMLDGWNPFGPDAAMLWQNIYPSACWGVQAALSAFFGSIEAAKTLHVWWLYIALPALLAGIACHLPRLRMFELLAVLCCLLSPVLLGQMLTHYVDTTLYLAGLTFMGGLLLYAAPHAGLRLAALMLMVTAVAVMVNVKLSGIYHAVTLCAAATGLLWWRSHAFPRQLCITLLAAGLVAVLAIGYRPYVTNIVRYGSLLHMDGEEFSGAQRPSSFDGLLPPTRFLYSLYSATGGNANKPAELKWPGQMLPYEWRRAGLPDNRTGGFGPLFSLGFTLAMLASLPLLRGKRWQQPVALLGLACLFFSMVFPQGWWLRYVPFAYTAPFLLLLAAHGGGRLRQAMRWASLAAMAANIAVCAQSVASYNDEEDQRFTRLVLALQALPGGSVYLVPPGDDYLIYNHGFESLQRRLGEFGITTTIKVDAPCPREVDAYSEFRICY